VKYRNLGTAGSAVRARDIPAPQPRVREAEDRSPIAQRERMEHRRDRAGTTQPLCTNNWTNPSVIIWITVDHSVGAPANRPPLNLTPPSLLFR
jgi:hypothetical protein